MSSASVKKRNRDEASLATKQLKEAQAWLDRAKAASSSLVNITPASGHGEQQLRLLAANPLGVACPLHDCLLPGTLRDEIDARTGTLLKSASTISVGAAVNSNSDEQRRMIEDDVLFVALVQQIMLTKKPPTAATLTGDDVLRAILCASGDDDATVVTVNVTPLLGQSKDKMKVKPNTTLSSQVHIRHCACCAVPTSRPQVHPKPIDGAAVPFAARLLWLFAAARVTVQTQCSKKGATDKATTTLQHITNLVGSPRHEAMRLLNQRVLALNETDAEVINQSSVKEGNSSPLPSSASPPRRSASSLHRFSSVCAALQSHSQVLQDLLGLGSRFSQSATTPSVLHNIYLVLHSSFFQRFVVRCIALSCVATTTSSDNKNAAAAASELLDSVLKFFQYVVALLRHVVHAVVADAILSSASTAVTAVASGVLSELSSFALHVAAAVDGVMPRSTPLESDGETAADASLQMLLSLAEFEEEVRQQQKHKRVDISVGLVAGAGAAAAVGAEHGAAAAAPPVVALGASAFATVSQTTEEGSYLPSLTSIQTLAGFQDSAVREWQARAPRDFLCAYALLRANCFGSLVHALHSELAFSQGANGTPPTSPSWRVDVSSVEQVIGFGGSSSSPSSSATANCLSALWGKPIRVSGLLAVDSATTTTATRKQFPTIGALSVFAGGQWWVFWIFLTQVDKLAQGDSSATAATSPHYCELTGHLLHHDVSLLCGMYEAAESPPPPLIPSHRANAACPSAFLTLQPARENVLHLNQLLALREMHKLLVRNDVLENGGTTGGGVDPTPLGQVTMAQRAADGCPKSFLEFATGIAHTTTTTTTTAAPGSSGNATTGTSSTTAAASSSVASISISAKQNFRKAVRQTEAALPRQYGTQTFNPEQFDALNSFVENPNPLCVLEGTVGSGKSMVTECVACCITRATDDDAATTTVQESQARIFAAVAAQREGIMAAAAAPSTKQDHHHQLKALFDALFDKRASLSMEIGKVAARELLDDSTNVAVFTTSAQTCQLCDHVGSLIQRSSSCGDESASSNGAQRQRLSLLLAGGAGASSPATNIRKEATTWARLLEEHDASGRRNEPNMAQEDDEEVEADFIAAWLEDRNLTCDHIRAYTGTTPEAFPDHVLYSSALGGLMDMDAQRTLSSYAETIIGHHSKQQQSQWQKQQQRDGVPATTTASVKLVPLPGLTLAEAAERAQLAAAAQQLKQLLQLEQQQQQQSESFAQQLYEDACDYFQSLYTQRYHYLSLRLRLRALTALQRRERRLFAAARWYPLVVASYEDLSTTATTSGLRQQDGYPLPPPLFFFFTPFLNSCRAVLCDDVTSAQFSALDAVSMWNVPAPSWRRTLSSTTASSSASASSLRLQQQHQHSAIATPSALAPSALRYVCATALSEHLSFFTQQRSSSSCSANARFGAENPLLRLLRDQKEAVAAQQAASVSNKHSNKSSLALRSIPSLQQQQNAILRFQKLNESYRFEHSPLRSVLSQLLLPTQQQQQQTNDAEAQTAALQKQLDEAAAADDAKRTQLCGLHLNLFHWTHALRGQQEDVVQLEKNMILRFLAHYGQVVLRSATAEKWPTVAVLLPDFTLPCLGDEDKTDESNLSRAFRKLSEEVREAVAAFDKLRQSDEPSSSFVGAANGCPGTAFDIVVAPLLLPETAFIASFSSSSSSAASAATSRQEQSSVAALQRWLIDCVCRCKKGFYVISHAAASLRSPPLQRVKRVVLQVANAKQQRSAPPASKTSSSSSSSSTTAADVLALLGDMAIVSPALPMHCPHHERTLSLLAVKYDHEEGDDGVAASAKSSSSSLRRDAASVQLFASGECKCACLQTYQRCLQPTHRCLRTCHAPAEDDHSKCPFPCARVFPCGHGCAKACHEPCAACSFQDLVQLACGGQRVVSGYVGKVVSFATFPHFQLVRCGAEPGPCAEQVTKTCDKCGFDFSDVCSAPMPDACENCEKVIAKVKQDHPRYSPTEINDAIGKARHTSQMKFSLLRKKIALQLSSSDGALASHEPYQREKRRVEEALRRKQQLSEEFAHVFKVRQQDVLVRFKGSITQQQATNTKLEVHRRNVGSVIDAIRTSQLDSTK